MWIRYRMSDGLWEINTRNIEFFMRSCAHTHAVLQNSTTNTERNTFGPDLTTVDIDWPAARKDRDERAEAELHEFFNRLDATQGGKVLRDMLVTLKVRSDADDAAYLKKVRNAQKQTIDNVDSSVATGKVAESVAVFIRDASATILLTSATLLTGGAILPLVGVLAAGTGLKFVAKYQDTGDFDAAAFTASAELGVALIGIGTAGAPTVIRTVIALTGSTGIAAGSAVMEGKDVAVKSEAKAAGGVVDRVVFRQVIAPAFSRSPQGIIVSGVISNGTKLIAEAILDRSSAGAAIEDVKRAPFIVVPEAMIALTPEEHFIETAIMRNVDQTHTPIIPFR